MASRSRSNIGAPKTPQALGQLVRKGLYYCRRFPRDTRILGRSKPRIAVELSSTGPKTPAVTLDGDAPLVVMKGREWGRAGWAKTRGEERRGGFRVCYRDRPV